MQNIKTIIQGSVMGIVETIPGVSASTLALIMGIYDQFVDVLHEVSEVMKTSLLWLGRRRTFSDVRAALAAIQWRFGILLFLGMLLGVGVFSHVMSFSLENFPAYTFAFFFGLILASLPVPWQRLESVGRREIAIALGTAALFFLFLGLKPAALAGAPPLWLVFVGGAIGICAMVLPGVSGSFVLLLMGLYDYVIGAVKNFTRLDVSQAELASLFVLALGVLVGFATFVRALKIWLERYPAFIMSFLVGLMLGSLRVLWPYDKLSPGVALPSESLITTLIILVTTAGVVYLNSLAVRDPGALEE